MNSTLTFSDVNTAALSRGLPLLEVWLPGGRLRGHEYTCGDLTGGPGDSCKVNIDTGKWADFATGEAGGDHVSLYAAIHGMKQGDALRELAQEFGVAGGHRRIKLKHNPKPKPKALEWAGIMPVPADGPAPTFEHSRLGKPSAVWVYRDREGNILGYACRFDGPGGKKDILPLTFCSEPGGYEKWRWQGFPEPRPMYGLNRLGNGSHDAHVLMVEGEKTADAATQLCGSDVVCMTWPGGCKAVGMVDFSPLAGHVVKIWPDADKPGFEAALALADLLKNVGAGSVALVVPPTDVKQGWDLADAEAEGWTADKVTAWMRDNTITLEQFEVIAQEHFGVEVKPMVADVEQVQSHQYQAAMRALDSIGRENLVHAMSSFWRWRESGIWRRIDDLEIKQVVQRGEADNAKLTGPLVSSVLSLIQNEVYRSDHEFDRDRQAINCLNGELHWTGSGWELRPHQRESYRTTQIPVAYDPTAVAPRFVQFLGEVFFDDEDQEDKTVTACEAIGYSLLSNCEYEKFIMCIGPGANGKSVLMDTLTALVGSANTSAVQPSQFEHRFQRGHLHAKLVNLVTEIAEGAEIADAQLKAIVSGEITTGEHKHKDPFEFTPICTCWFGTNHMPHTRDFSAALFRRAVILTFNRTFSEFEQDKKLKGKLRAELPGILNLALEAMAGVFDRGCFTAPKSSEVAKSEWRLEADQVAQFVEDCCVAERGYKVNSAEMYWAYKAWAEDAGIRRTLNRKNFTDRMRKLGAAIAKSTGGIRVLLGFRLARASGR